MVFRALFGLLSLLIFCSYNQHTSKSRMQFNKGSNTQIKSKSGLKIEYGPNLGTTHIDTTGAKHFYVHITATITNDSTIPIQLNFALATEFEFPVFCDDTKYKVFLLPEDLTPDTATIYNNIVNGQHDFLNKPLDPSNTFNKILQPGEYCVVTIGTLTRKPSNCALVPRAVFSHDTRELYQTCDSQSNKAIPTDPHLDIGVKLEFYYKRKFIAPEDGCTIIPFGQISYPEP